MKADLELQNNISFEWELIRKTVCKFLNDEDFETFKHVCVQTKLDPLLKQIYVVKRGERMTIQTSIDGFRLIADRTGNYSPGKETTFVYDENKKIVSATSYVKKRTNDGIWHEISAIAFYKEYEPKNGKHFWDNMPHLMIAKCAEALALRKAFPAELGGIYTTEEMEQADSEIKPNVKNKEPVNAANEDCTNEFLNVDQVKKIEELVGADHELADKILSAYSKKYGDSVDTFYDIKAKDFGSTLHRIQLTKHPRPTVRAI